MPKYELYGARGCPYTQEMREWLEYKGMEFIEHDIETDSAARERMIELSGGQRTVPVLVSDGRVVQVGWQGRGCAISGPIAK
jgi:glutaredoxin